MKFIPGLIVAVLTSAPSWAGFWPDKLKEADTAFEQGLYQEALAKYEAIVPQAPEEIRLKAFYRSTECKALLFRYAQAAQSVSTFTLPADALWRARFLLLKTELGRAYLDRYGFAAPEDRLNGQEDAAKLTRQQWNKLIAENYDALWQLRETLARIPLTGEEYFIESKKTDLSLTPTLWDFAVLRWTDYLLNTDIKSAGKLKAADFITPDYKIPFSTQSAPAVKAASVMEAALPDNPARKEAAELWKIKRLLIPFSARQAFAASEADKSLGIDVLLGWMNTFSGVLARAEAGYEAALLLKNGDKLKEAADTCALVKSRFPKTSSGGKCASMIASIKTPALDLNAKPMPPTGGKGISITSRGLEKVYFRLYKTSPEQLVFLAQGGRPGAGIRPGNWQSLRYLNPETLKGILKNKPQLAWNAGITYPAMYKQASTEIDMPAAKKGLYIAAACSDKDCRPGESLIRAAILNVTDLMLFGSSGFAGTEQDFTPDPLAPAAPFSRNGFHLAVVNAATGRPAANAMLDTFYYNNTRNEKTILFTDRRGQAELSVPFANTYPANGYFVLDPLAELNGAYAYLNTSLQLHYYTPAPISVFAETDRPIYRPGQEVKFKVTALLKQPQEYRVYSKGAPVKVTARDANRQEFFSATLYLNDMGSAAGSFAIPAGRLLGGYELLASVEGFGHTFNTARNFSVEEYKRPEFEVELFDAKDTLVYGKSSKIEGAAKYYFGGPVADAKVSYKITRQRYIPWFCWWWQPYDAQPAEVASGSVQTGADGRFSLEFTPAPDSDDRYPSSFVVEAQALEAEGRVITAAKTYRAGNTPYLFDIAKPAGFITEGAAARLTVVLRNLNDQPVKGLAEYALYRLDGAPPARTEIHEGNVTLDEAFQPVPDGSRLAQGKLDCSGQTPGAIDIPPLREGAYRLKLKSEADGRAVEHSLVLICVNPRAKTINLDLPALAIPEREEYEPGETARILVGAGALKGYKYAQIWAGPYLLEQSIIEEGGLSVLKIPVTKSHKGGFSVRWFGASGFRAFGAEAYVRVPHNEERLALSLDYAKTLAPGAKTKWVLKAEDSKGKPAAGEATVRIFDRSLEYYAKDAGFWTANLYPARRGTASIYNSYWKSATAYLAPEKGWIKQLFDSAEPETESLPYPRMRLSSSMFGWEDFAAVRGAAGMAKGILRKDVLAPMSAASAANAGFKDRERNETLKSRANFAETAYFNPQLNMANGKAAFSFSMPERLTSWKIDAYLLTKDAKTGSISAQALTAKELMARLETPRFFREGDRSLITATVHNETDAVMSGEAAIYVVKNGQPAESLFGIGDNTARLKLGPRSSQNFSWSIAVPPGTGELKIKIAAAANGKTDAEEKTLPILPARERIIASKSALLDGATAQSIVLSQLSGAPAAAIESAHLQIEPQLALTVLNSLPALVRYPHECTEQLVNRFVPLSIVNSIYNSYPELKKAAAKIPARKTITPAWESDNPLRLALLMETPWLSISKGIAAELDATDILNPELVEKERSAALSKLKSYQLPGGAFPWFPGGEPDLYMTLYLLDGFAQALRYNVAVPEDTAKKAISYASRELTQRLKPEEANVALLLYGAYVLTSFPADWKQAGMLKYARIWVDFADTHSNAMTPLGKAYAANIYARLGDGNKSALYLKRMLDGAREDAAAGTYWTPEKISWLWYNDTAEKHAFILRTLAELEPRNPMIPGMVKWLLFNRKANQWKSTRASAAAIYAILEFMNKRGALGKGDSFLADWNGQTFKAGVSPYGWIASPIRWSAYSGDIKGPSAYSARIEKTGPGTAYASLSCVYYTDAAQKESPDGVLNLRRKYFLRYREGQEYRLKPLADGDTVAVGDEIEVHLTINSKSAFEYAHLKDPHATGFEPEKLLSGWQWQFLPRYEEMRDSLTNFFMERLPHGEYELSYRLRPTLAGRYAIGPATLQSMYAPEFAANSDGITLNVSR